MSSLQFGPVRHVQDLEPVSAPVINRATRDLEQRVTYLQQQLEAATLGQQLFQADAPIDPAVQVGDAVYYDTSQARFARAVLQTTTVNGAVVLANSAWVHGVVTRKSSQTVADICLSGLTTIGGTPLPVSWYYLAPGSAGVLTSTRPVFGVLVGYAYGDGKFLVRLEPRDAFDAHTHRQLELICEPAGGNSVVSSRHVITSPDADLPGWLPATHAAFTGMTIPSGAKFGYNVDADPQLRAAWPPASPDQCVAFWTPDAAFSGQLVGPELLQINADGLWWMSDCFGYVPWPGTDGYSSDYETFSPNDCPPDVAMRLLLVFTQLAADLQQSVVTRLSTEVGSPLQLVDCDGQPGNTGDLLLKFAYSLMLQGADAAGSLVVKDIDTAGRLLRGRVVESILPGTGLTITSTHTSGNLRQGAVTIGLDSNNAGTTVQPAISRLGDAKERTYQDLSYVGFQAGRVATVQYQFQIPPGMGGNCRLRLRLLARINGTLPALTVQRRTMAEATVATAFVPTLTALSITTAVALQADQYLDVFSDAFTVAVGDVVTIIVTRAASDGYSGEVALVSATIVR